MSGGSFNYLFNKDLVCSDTELGDMLDEIKELTGNDIHCQAYKDTEEILTKMREIDTLQKKLSDLWHDIEWYRSNDYSKLQALTTLVEYEKEHKK